MRLIGFIGVKGAGKDTAAKHLVDHESYVRLAFADKLYQEVASAFSTTVEHLGQRETKETPQDIFALSRCSDPSFVEVAAKIFKEAGEQLDVLELPRSPRVIMQLWGTEYRRKNGVDSYWLDIIERKLLENPEQDVCITDVRFINEANFIKRHGGTLIRVTRPAVEAEQALERARNGTAAHSSETELLTYPVDHVVRNEEGRPDVLVAELKKALNLFVTT